MNKRITWSWSTTGLNLAGCSHAEIRTLCASAGLAGIEGAAPLFQGIGPERAAQIGEEYRRQGLRMDSFHLPYSPQDDVASFYESERLTTVASIRHWLEVAAAAGARVCVLHPSTSRHSVDDEGLDPFLRALGRSLEVLLPAAEDLGTTIALENMLPGPKGGRLGSRPEHFTAFLQAFDHPALGFCLDTGHALVAAHGQAAAFIEAMAPRLCAFHLADNAGDRDSHLAPGRGRVDWAAVFTKLAELQFAHPVCIETPPFDCGPPYAVEAWAGMVTQTQELAERVLAD